MAMPRGCTSVSDGCAFGDIPGYALMPRGEFCSTTVFYRDLEIQSETENRGFRTMPASQATAENVRVIACDESFSEAILSILNHEILNSTAFYDYKPRALDSMTAWFAAKHKGNYPVIGPYRTKVNCWASPVTAGFEHGLHTNIPSNTPSMFRQHIKGKGLASDCSRQ